MFPSSIADSCTESFSLLLQNLYRWAGVNALPTGYSLPTDTPNFQHAKHVQHIGSDVSQALNPSKSSFYTMAMSSSPR